MYLCEWRELGLEHDLVFVAFDQDTEKDGRFPREALKVDIGCPLCFGEREVSFWSHRSVSGHPIPPYWSTRWSRSNNLSTNPFGYENEKLGRSKIALVSPMIAS